MNTVTELADILEREELLPLSVEVNEENVLKMIERLAMSYRNVIEINKVERQNVIDLQDRVKAEMEKAEKYRKQVDALADKLKAEREKVAELKERVMHEVEICELMNRKINSLEEMIPDYDVYRDGGLK